MNFSWFMVFMFMFIENFLNILSANVDGTFVTPTLTLSEGIEMPIVGYGTYRARDSELEQGLNWALETGYRHIDTATIYENEETIGRVLKKWFDSGKLQRKDIFLVTKLPPTGNRASSVEKYLRRSLRALQVDYVDLYLIHAPYAFKDVDNHLRPRTSDGHIDLDLNNDHISTWKEMERQVETGLTRAIGVSNFNKTQLKRLLDNSKIKPANLQIEIHAYLQQTDMVDFCKENNVTVTAYSPIGNPELAKILERAGDNKNISGLLTNPVVQKIADKHHKTAAQVLLRFTTQRGIAVIPKSLNKDRIQQNINIFDFTLDEEDIKELKTLDAHIRLFSFHRYSQITKHPEFPFQNEL